MKKLNVCVLFGGISPEHEVSLRSAEFVLNSLDPEKYNIIPVGITKDGHWIRFAGTDYSLLPADEWREQPGNRSAAISPIRGQGLLSFEGDCVVRELIDVVFPVLHGENGEDGAMQGLLQMAGIPYVGCGVFASAASMDKFYTKLVVDTLGIRQAIYVGVIASELKNMDSVVAKVEAKLSYPVFIKPSKAGSSKGVSKADNREMLIAGLLEAAKHDYKILVEETIVGRELECAVIGYDKTTKASGIGEILAAAEFYDFDAKYNNAESKTVIDPELPEGKAEEIRECAVKIFNALDGFGLSRVDFFLEKDTGSVVFNEINTLPGFTSISMYPMLWKAKGYTIESLVEELIEMAVERP